MSSLYSWHDEQMVRLEMREVYNEIEQIRLLNDANQTRSHWLAQKLSKFAGWLSKIGLPLQKRLSTPVPQYYQSTSFKCSR